MKLVQKNLKETFFNGCTLPLLLYYLYFCSTVFVQPALAFPFFFPFRLLFLSFFLFGSRRRAPGLVGTVFGEFSF